MAADHKPLSATTVWLCQKGLQVSVLAIALGAPIAHGFSIANLGQVLALLLLLPAFRLLRTIDAAALLALTVGVVVSPLPLMFGEDATPKWAQVAFFVLAVIQVSLCIRLAPHLDSRKLLRAPVNIASLLLVLAVVAQVSSGQLSHLDLFFDDKSHAAVAAYCLTFLVMWVNEGTSRLLIAVAVFFAGVATASRLLLLGVPFLGIAAFVEYWRSRKLARTPLGVYVHHLALMGAAVAAVMLSRTDMADALAYRLTRGNQLSTRSTEAHLELIRMAVELKAADALVMVFGVGPGGFGPGVRAEGISAGALPFYDPGAYQSMMAGFAPIHSATLSFLVEFPMWFAGAFVLLWIKIVLRLWQQRETTLMLLALGLLAVTSLYSTHNEYLYTSAVSVLCLVAFSGQMKPRSSLDVGGDRPLSAEEAPRLPITEPGRLPQPLRHRATTGRSRRRDE